MSRWKTAGSYGARPDASSFGPFVVVAVLAVAAAAPGLAVLWLIRAPVVLPAVGLAFLAAAGCLGLLAWQLGVKRRTQHINLWDVAGACAFIGFAAGIISQPEQVLQLFGYGTTAP
jgi:hypothetical protein